jgi:hypothetical protein
VLDVPANSKGAPPRAAARVVLLLAAFLGAGAAASAASVDGAGRIMVVPLVFSGTDRTTVINMSNPGAQPLTITSQYVGAQGTPLVGPHSCLDQRIGPGRSLALDLDAMCAFPPRGDVDNVGYLEMTASADSRFTFMANAVILTNSNGETSAIPAQPIGAYTPAFSEAFVLGLRTEGPTSPTGEVFECFVGTFDLGKKVGLELRDNSNTIIGSLGMTMGPRRMMRANLAKSLPLANRDNLRVRITSKDTAAAILGCAIEHKGTRAVAWQPAQSPAAMDASRLKSVDVRRMLHEGPYNIDAEWFHTLTGATMDLKVTLTTYLQADDVVRCYLEPSFAGADLMPWLEMQVRGPDGLRVAGGNGAKDTGFIQTGPRGRYPASMGNRWFIDVSLDEDAFAQTPFPFNWWWGTGEWGMHCDSAAGMSEPIGLPNASTGNTDDF